jgi:zinc transport system substrate-binding protein
VNNLAEGLTAAMPQHADAIEANRAAYVQRLQALDAEMLAALEGLPHLDVITFHEAFPYFAAAYGLNVAAVLNHEPEDALSPRALAELCKTVKSLGTPPLFIEPQYEDAAARTVSRETGAPVYILDPIVTGPGGDVPLTWYEDVMRSNLAVLLDALGT